MTISSKTGTSHIEQFPPEILGLISGYITVWTGSCDLINEADIRPTLRSVRNLTLTSKTMYNKIHQIGSLRLLFETLAKTYQKAEEHFISQWHSRTIPTYLKIRVKENGDLQSYEILLSIRKVVASIEKQAKEAQILQPHESLRLSEPDPSVCRTKSGFILWHNGVDWPFFASPFGVVRFENIETQSLNAMFSITAALINKLSASFLKDDKPDCLNVSSSFACLPLSPLNTEIVKYISDDELNLALRNRLDYNDVCRRSKGPEKFLWISGRKELFVLYRIDEVDDTKLPQAIQDQEIRCNYVVNQILRTLKGETTTLPISSWKSPQQNFKKFTSLQEVLQNSIKAFSLLSSGKHRLVFSSRDEAETLEVLHKCSENLDKSLNQIQYDRSGLQMNLTQNDPSSFEHVSKVYEQTLTRIGKGWQQVCLRNHTHLLHKHSEDDYVLLHKSDRCLQNFEEILIRLLCRQFSLKGVDVIGGISELNQPLYLWIPKNLLENVKNQLGIQI